MFLLRNLENNLPEYVKIFSFYNIKLNFKISKITILSKEWSTLFDTSTTLMLDKGKPSY